MKRGLFIYILLVTFVTHVALSVAQTGPVEPSKELVPKSSVKDIEKLDLPYKPRDDVDVIGDNLLVSPDVTSPGEGLLNEEDQKKKGIDWTTLPFVPSKNPEFPPAGDPEI